MHTPDDHWIVDPTACVLGRPEHQRQVERDQEDDEQPLARHHVPRVEERVNPGKGVRSRGCGCCCEKVHARSKGVYGDDRMFTNPQASVKPPGDRPDRAEDTSEPHTTTAPSRPASAIAAARAATGSATARPPADACQHRRRSAPASLLDSVAITVSVTDRRLSTIAGTSFSPRVENTATVRRPSSSGGSSPPAGAYRRDCAHRPRSRADGGHATPTAPEPPPDPSDGIDRPPQCSLHRRLRHRAVLILEAAGRDHHPRLLPPVAPTIPPRPRSRWLPHAPPPASRVQSPRASHRAAECVPDRCW